MKTGILITLSAFFLGTIQLHSQSSSVASGGEAKGNGGLVSYSIGQIATSFSKGQNGSVSEGVQNPYEIYIINQTDDLLSGFSIYPNPASDYLILRFDGIRSGATSFVLRNIEGHVLQHTDISDQETYIDMSAFPPSTLFLSISYKDKILKTFKIIKIKKS